LKNFRKYIDGSLNNKEGCFFIIDKKINEIIGITIYYSFDENEHLVKIGYTFIFNEYWELI
tara:strand:- start:439 stop:621 length:183 start_codon:yes stop_codon:yes gene_type:complete